MGIYVWDVPCSGHEVRDSQVSWLREDGEANPCCDGDNCGPIDGWDDNDWEADLAPALLEVSL